MNLKRTCFYAGISLLLAATSCKKNEIMANKENSGVAAMSLNNLANATSFITDTIYPLEVDTNLINIKKQKRAVAKVAEDQDNELSAQLFEIREIPFNVFVRSNGNVLTTNGKGKEIFLSPATSNNIKQQLYVKILPSTSGIPYLIYSKQDNMPVAIGQAGKNGDKVLYTVTSESGSTYNFGWDIKNSNTNGYQIIESLAYIGQGGNGPWDIFSYVLQANSTSKLGFARYAQASNQEFSIKPLVTFTLNKVQFKDEYRATVTPRENFGVERTYANYGYTTVNTTMHFDDEVSEASSFNEFKGLNLTLTGLDKLFKRPTVVNGEIRVNPGDNIQADTKYINYGQVNHKLEGELPVAIRPRKELKVIYYYQTYDLEVPYEVTADYGDRKVKINGIWRGTIHVNGLRGEDHLTVETDLDNGFRKTKKYSQYIK